jgi:hypothetical protein
MPQGARGCCFPMAFYRQPGATLAPSLPRGAGEIFPFFPWHLGPFAAASCFCFPYPLRVRSFCFYLSGSWRRSRGEYLLFVTFRFVFNSVSTWLAFGAGAAESTCFATPVLMWHSVSSFVILVPSRSPANPAPPQHTHHLWA